MMSVDVKEIVTERCCYIFGAGEYGECDLPDPLQGFVIAADAGLAVLQKKGIVPDLLVGDFDSLKDVSQKAPEEYAGDQKEAETEKEGISGRIAGMLPQEKILCHPPEKDDTDMMLAVKEGLRRGYREFRIYGGLGGRLDHTFANVQTLEYIAMQGGRGYLIGERETLTVIRNDCLIIPEGAQPDCRYISVFCLGDKAEGVSLRNLKYPLENAVLTKEFPLGVSNEFTGEKAQIEVMQGSLLVIMENRT